MNYWGARYEALNQAFSLGYTHRLSFIRFIALVRVHEDNYRLINIYLNNPRWATRGVTLLDFLQVPAAYLRGALDPCVLAQRAAFPLLPKQQQAAMQFEFSSKALIEYWEHVLDRQATQECRGSVMIEPMHKRNRVPLWKRCFMPSAKAKAARNARYRCLDGKPFFNLQEKL